MIPRYSTLTHQAPSHASKKELKTCFVPSGVCSTVSVRHEGERPVQKYGLKKEEIIKITDLKGTFNNSKENTCILHLLQSSSLCGEICKSELVLETERGVMMCTQRVWRATTQI